MSNDKTSPTSIAGQLQENFVSLKNSHFLVLDRELAAVADQIATERAKQSHKPLTTTASQNETYVTSPSFINK